jgi:hypothetical protein
MLSKKQPYPFQKTLGGFLKNNPMFVRLAHIIRAA